MAATAQPSTAVHLPWPLNTFTFGSLDDLSPSPAAKPTPTATRATGIHLPGWLYTLLPDRVLYTLNSGTRGATAVDLARRLRDGVDGIVALAEFCRAHVDEERGGWFLDAVYVPTPLKTLVLF